MTEETAIGEVRQIRVAEHQHTAEADGESEHGAAPEPLVRQEEGRENRRPERHRRVQDGRDAALYMLLTGRDEEEREGGREDGRNERPGQNPPGVDDPRPLEGDKGK